MVTKAKQLLEKLMDRWGVDNFWQVAVILVIFSISGMTVLYLKTFIFDFLGFGAETPFWKLAVTWVLTVVPSYQVVFLFYGFILGQFEFAWRFEKESFQRIKGLLSGNRKP